MSAAAATEDVATPFVIAALERALGTTLPHDSIRHCRTRDELTRLVVAHLAATGDGPSLRVAALGAVREALRDVARTDREEVGELLCFEDLKVASSRPVFWREFGRELDCDLPPTTHSPQAALGALLLLAVLVYLCAGTRESPDEIRLIMLTLLGLPVLATALLVGRLSRFPAPAAYVAGVVTWLVAHRAVRLRGGMQWSPGQVKEVVDAVFKVEMWIDSLRRERLTTWTARFLVAGAGATLASYWLLLVFRLVVT